MKCGEKLWYDQIIESMCFARFDLSFLPQTMADNKRNVAVWKACQNDNERGAVEKENNTRWPELYELCYFDYIRCSVVDPMNNLFLFVGEVNSGFI